MNSRQAANDTLVRLWDKIAVIEREYYESGQSRVDLKVQLEHMRKQCMEIIEEVHKNEQQAIKKAGY